MTTKKAKGKSVLIVAFLIAALLVAITWACPQSDIIDRVKGIGRWDETAFDSSVFSD